MLEDASQAHGSLSSECHIAGSVGDISAFSLYPGKNDNIRTDPISSTPGVKLEWRVIQREES